MTDLKPCPFCGEKEGLIPGTFTGDRYSVSCSEGCQTEGPWCTTEGEAIKEWNKRSEAK